MIEKYPITGKELPEENTIERTNILHFKDISIDLSKLAAIVQSIPTTPLSVYSCPESLNEKDWLDATGTLISCSDLIEICRAAGGLDNVPAAHPELTERVMRVREADTSFPILVYKDRILDGKHRLVKTILEGHTSI